MEVDLSFFVYRIDGDWGFEVLVSPELTGSSQSGPLKSGGEGRTVEFASLN